MAERSTMLNVQGWNARLNEATTSAGVLRVARDFVSQWTSQHLEELPADCRPGLLEEADEIAPYAVKLIQRHCREDSYGSPRLTAMANFFAAASQRLSKISASAARLALNASMESEEGDKT